MHDHLGHAETQCAFEQVVIAGGHDEGFERLEYGLRLAQQHLPDGSEPHRAGITIHELKA